MGQIVLSRDGFWLPMGYWHFEPGFGLLMSVFLQKKHIEVDGGVFPIPISFLLAVCSSCCSG